MVSAFGTGMVDVVVVVVLLRIIGAVTDVGSASTIEIDSNCLLQQNIPKKIVAPKPVCAFAVVALI